MKQLFWQVDLLCIAKPVDTCLDMFFYAAGLYNYGQASDQPEVTEREIL